MSTEVHIERPGGEITLDEWSAVVASTDDVRLLQNSVSAINPFSGERIEMTAAPGAAEYVCPDEGVWRPGIRFHSGRVSVEVHDELDEGSPLRQMLTELAANLKGVLVNDDGELFE